MKVFMRFFLILAVVTILPAGAYYIQIRYMYHGGEGPYTLILGNGSGPVLTEANK